MTTAHNAESTPFLDLWQDKIFLGQEFLTWLWLSSEINNSFNVLGGQAKVEIWFENSLRLESGLGVSKRSVSCLVPSQSVDNEWTEAFVAIWENKKVVKGRLKLRTPEREWALTLSSDTIAPQAVKLTSGGNFEEDGELGQAGLFLEKVSFLTELLTILESLYENFLKIRLTSEWENKEIPRLRQYVKKRTEEGLGL